MKYLFLFYVAIGLQSQLIAQLVSNCIPNPEAGKVYGKCLVEKADSASNQKEQLLVIEPAKWELVWDTVYFDPKLDGDLQT